jgi:hypothetical protein
LDPESYSIVKDRSQGQPVAGWPPRRGISIRERRLRTSLGFALLRAARFARRLHMVELIGIEPTTSGLQSPRSPS